MKRRKKSAAKAPPSPRDLLLAAVKEHTDELLYFAAPRDAVDQITDELFEDGVSPLEVTDAMIRDSIERFDFPLAEDHEDEA